MTAQPARSLGLTLAALSAVVLLAACSSGADPIEEAPEPTPTVTESAEPTIALTKPAEPTEAEPPPPTTADPADRPTADAIEIGQVYEDTDFGNTITVVAFVPWFQVPPEMRLDLAGDYGQAAFFLVNLTLAPDNFFAMRLNPDLFDLSCDGAEATSLSAEAALLDQMEAAGFNPIRDMAESGAVAEGWVPYLVPDTVEPANCALDYRRLPLVVTNDNNREVPAWEITVELN